MYASNEDLPIVCQLNLPEAAQHVYRTAFNHAWTHAAEPSTRFRDAQLQAWDEVRKQFTRVGGRWVARDVPVSQPHGLTVAQEL
jgi:cation transport regulator